MPLEDDSQCGYITKLKPKKKKEKKKGCVSHCGLAIYIKKHLKAKEEGLWKLKYFTMPKYHRSRILI
jgi:hypothetical protein